jgi:hypothetical protein
MTMALFWFYKGYSITDEPAIEALKDFNIQRAIDIWSRMIAKGEVTQKTCSAFHNLSTLLLHQSVGDKPINEVLLEQGIQLKLQFLDSDWVQELKLKATDETFETTKIEVQQAFLNTLQQELKENVNITPVRWIALLLKCKFSAKEAYLSNFIQKLINPIETKIETAIIKRNADNAKAAVAGRELYHSVVNELEEMQSGFGMSNIKYSSVVDKVAEEILQCGIDYFKYHKNDNYAVDDFADISMGLLKKAQSLAIGTMLKKRCEENINELQEWTDGKPERDKHDQVKDDLEKMKTVIEEYSEKSPTIANAEQFLWDATPYLINIGTVLSKNDDLYLALSTKIASEVQGMYASEINELQGSVLHSSDKAQSKQLLQLRAAEACRVSNLISAMDLQPDFRSNYDANRAALLNLMNQFAPVDRSKNIPMICIRLSKDACKIVITAIRKILNQLKKLIE